jgi:hypothetical protein
LIFLIPQQSKGVTATAGSPATAETLASMYDSNTSRTPVAEQTPTTVGKATTAKTESCYSSRESRKETTVRIHKQQAQQQHKRQLKRQGTPTTAGVPVPMETPVAECMLTKVGTLVGCPRNKQKIFSV